MSCLCTLFQPSVALLPSLLEPKTATKRHGKLQHPTDPTVVPSLDDELDQEAIVLKVNRHMKCVIGGLRHPEHQRITSNSTASGHPVLFVPEGSRRHCRRTSDGSRMCDPRQGHHVSTVIHGRSEPTDATCRCLPHGSFPSTMLAHLVSLGRSV